jgi:hypothetical protein
MHRAIASVDGTYALREPGEAYRSQSDSETDALMGETRLPGTNLLKFGDIGRFDPRMPGFLNRRVRFVIRPSMLGAIQDAMRWVDTGMAELSINEVQNHSSCRYIGSGFFRSRRIY